MFVVCWSVKGGVGTSVVAAAIAVVSAEQGHDTVLVDLAGDQPAVLGCEGDDRQGVGDWLSAGDGVPVDALAALEIEVGPRLHLIPRGAPVCPDRLGVLSSVLGGSGRVVVVDGGVGIPHWMGSGRSVLILRSCYLTLRRVSVVPAGTDVVLLDEPGRALRGSDVSMAVGQDPWRRISVEPGVARAVDAGLLAFRLPRSLRSLSLVP